MSKMRTYFSVDKSLIIVMILFIGMCYYIINFNKAETVADKDDKKAGAKGSDAIGIQKCKRMDNFEEAIKYVKNNIINCLEKEFDLTKIDDHLFMRHLAGCVTRHVPIDFNDFDVYSRRKEFSHIWPIEKKHFLPIKDEKNATCVWLTAGIGGEWLSVEEWDAKNKTPNCHFYGIEANKNAYGHYPKFGTVIPHAVGVEDSTQQLNVNGHLSPASEIKVRGIDKLLDEYVGRKTVYYASFDVEGIEKNLIDGMTYDGPITKNGVSFCQVDWEVHADDIYKLVSINPDRIQTMMKIIKNSPYLPILVNPIWDSYFFNKYFHHVTLLHTENLECRRVFGLAEKFRLDLC